MILIMGLGRALRRHPSDIRAYSSLLGELGLVSLEALCLRIVYMCTGFDGATIS